MRHFKKYFFESLIQLTILVNVYRQINENSENSFINNFTPYYLASSTYNNNSAITANTGQLDLLFNLQRTNSDYHTAGDQQTAPHLNNNYLTKELEFEFDEIRSIERRLNHRNNIIFNNPIQHNFITAPAFFNNNNTNPKELITQTENRIINQIELSKEDIQMDKDLQTILQQDIDLGITKSYCYEYGSSSCDQGYPDDPTGTKYEMYKGLEEQQERLKNADILTTTDIFQQQHVPEGYKLVLEEDTGESFLILISNDTSNNPSSSNSPNTLNNTDLIPSNQTANNTVQNDQSKRFEDLDIKVQVSIFLDNDTIERFYNKKLDPEYYSALREQNPSQSLRINSSSQDSIGEDDEPLFLDNSEINQELNKLTQIEQIKNPTNTNQVILDENDVAAIPLLEENLLNEAWMNNLLSSTDGSDAINLTNQSNTNFDNNNNNNNNNPNLYTNQINQNLSKSMELIEDKLTENNNSNNNFYMNRSVLNNQTTNQFLINDEFLATFDESLNKLENSSINNMIQSNISNQQVDASFESLLEEAINNHEITNNINMSRMNSTSLNLEGLNLTEFFNFANNTDEASTTTSTTILNSKNTNEIIINQAALGINTNITNNNNNQSLFPTQPSYSSSSLQENYADSAIINNHDKAKNNQEEDLIVVSKLKQEVIEIDGPLSSTISNQIGHNYNRELALNGLNHNHTYLNGASSEDAIYHPYSYKNKLKKMLKSLNNNTNGSQLQQESKDELLLRENKIGFSLSQIVESSADEFNEIIKNSSLNSDQINLIKDIRRRGKNKVAAQICRKRKIDSIDTLKEDVESLKNMKSKLQNEFNSIHNEIKEMTFKFDELYKETIGYNIDQNDPILAFINNLKTQLNARNSVQIETTPTAKSTNKSFNSEDSNSQEYDESNYDSEEEEEDDDDFADTAKNYNNSSSYDYHTQPKKLKKL